VKSAYLLCTYIGFVAGSLQVLAFADKWYGLGVLILITIILIIVCMVHARHSKPTKAIPKKLKNRVVRSSSKAKSKSKAIGGK
jgi:ABC-type transport system involved in cytochrome bd biosynthesis fused ATPase/permease subunit